MYARPDVNEQALIRYLGEIEADDRRTERIAAHANELIAGQFSPAMPDNVMEALAEMDESHWEDIAEFMETGDTDGLGRYVFLAITKYCASMANDLAEYEVCWEDKTACQRCSGRGCGKCLED